MSTLDERSLRPSERLGGRLDARLAALRVGPAAAVAGVVATLVTWLGSWNPSYWGDEAATVMSAERPLGTLVAELRQVDAVHGLYYLLMHVWIGAFGASELSTRLPSAFAVGAVVAGTVVLGARLAGLRFGLIAGLVCLVLPRTSYLATEARSYAIGTAIAVWVTVWFVGLVRRRDHRRRSWLLYGIFAGAAGYLFLYLLLLVPVHGLALAASRSGRRQLGRWVQGAVVAAVVALPIIAFGYLERGQIAFLGARRYANPYDVVVMQWFGDPKHGGSWVVPVLCWALIVVGVAVVGWRTARRRPDAVLENRSSDREVLRIGLAWLVLPTALLVAVDAWISPTYNIRYLSFSTPAAALLVALGAVALGRVLAPIVHRLVRPARMGRRGVVAVIGAVLLLTLIGAAVPGYLQQRGPFAKDGGSDWRQAADYVQAHAEPGDAAVFDQSVKPSRRPVLAFRLYPQQFAALSTPQIVTPYYDRAGLWDELAPVAQVRSELLAAPTVWALELPKAGVVPTDVGSLTDSGYRIVSIHRVHRTVIYQLQKEGT